MRITPKKIYIASLIIFIIAVSIFSIYTHIVENYRVESDDPIMLAVKEKLKLIHPDVSRLEFYESNKSYTINKQKVHLCLKDKNGDYYNENMLTYVGLHELAHVLCDEVGHTEKFYRVFDDLLDKAHEMGLYDPSIPIIQDYCMH
jgi:hypothetical protein